MANNEMVPVKPVAIVTVIGRLTVPPRNNCGVAAVDSAKDPTVTEMLIECVALPDVPVTVITVSPLALADAATVKVAG